MAVALTAQEMWNDDVVALCSIILKGILEKKWF